MMMSKCCLYTIPVHTSRDPIHAVLENGWIDPYAHAYAVTHDTPSGSSLGWQRVVQGDHSSFLKGLVRLWVIEKQLWRDSLWYRTESLTQSCRERLPCASIRYRANRCSAWTNLGQPPSVSFFFFVTPFLFQFLVSNSDPKSSGGHSAKSLDIITDCTL